MSSDTTRVLYECPISTCHHLSKSVESSEAHIKESDDAAHSGHSPEDLDTDPIPRSPQVPDLSFNLESARESIRNELERGDVSSYTELADRYDWPRSLVAHEIQKSMMGAAARMTTGKARTNWTDLTESQRAALLASSYFPEKTQYEIAELPDTPEDQGTVSHCIRNYAWMLYASDVRTPVNPAVEESQEGSVKTVGDTEDMLETYSDGGGAKATQATDNGGSGEETGDSSGVTIEVTEEQADELIESLFESNRSDLAEVVFKQTR